MIPVAGQQVQVTGIDGVFSVIDVDRQLKCAVLTPIGGPPEKMTVPFDLIESNR